MYGRLRQQDGLPAVHLVNDRKKERRTGSNLLLYLYLKKKKKKMIGDFRQCARYLCIVQYNHLQIQN